MCQQECIFQESTFAIFQDWTAKYTYTYWNNSRNNAHWNKKSVMFWMCNVKWAHLVKHLVFGGDTIFGVCGIFDNVTLLTDEDCLRKAFNRIFTDSTVNQSFLCLSIY